MERLIHHYLRILDIDRFGYFIRFINTSHHQSLDLSNISVRQCSIDPQLSNSTRQNPVLNSYTFKDQLRPLLHSGAVVTLYSKQYCQFECDIEPHIFIAQNVSRWLTDDHIRTELLLNKVVFNHYRTCLSATNDVPLLFINRPIYSQQLPRKINPNSNRCTRFVYPYCLPINNIVNPHTSAVNDQIEIKPKINPCHENNQTIKHFDSYPRRLTTTPTIIQSSKKTQQFEF